MTEQAKAGWVALLSILVFVFLTLSIWTADAWGVGERFALQGVLTAIFAIAIAAS